jgi:DNA-directed RNA polymerase specialized sigma24 family protein
MGRHSPYVLTPNKKQRRELERRVRLPSTPQRDVLRARIVLFAADGVENVEIADLLDVDADTVSKWRKRFFEEGTDGLSDRPRSGRPKVFSPLGPRHRQGHRL